MYETILYEMIGATARITLNRPDKFNSFTVQMFKELMDALKKSEKDPEVRCIVITGAGKAFNAGQDLEEIQGVDVDFGEMLRQRYNPLIMQIRKIEKPIIAAVNGVAAGAGVSLALACDLRLVSEKASFTNVFVNIGLIPDSGGCYFLPRIVGLGKALEMSMTGDKVTAEEAYRIGLANKVFPADTFEQEVMAYAARLAALPTKGIGMMKRTMLKGLHMTLEETLEYEAFAQETLRHTHDYNEGVQAFFEKRAPRFTGN